MIIDAVSVTTRDFAQSVRFYTALGFAFPAIAPDTQHIEAVTPPGATRLMIDDAGLMTGMIGAAPKPASHATFALLCDSPAAVDAAVAKVLAAGFTVTKQPWDAPWGQRYAVVADPEGYMVDLFAPL